MSDKQQTDNTNNSSKDLSNQDGTIDFSSIKTGGKFLTTVVGTDKVFCKEAFSEEEQMMYEAMSEFAENEILPISHTKMEEKKLLELVIRAIRGMN